MTEEIRCCALVTAAERINLTATAYFLPTSETSLKASLPSGLGTQPFT